MDNDPFGELACLFIRYQFGDAPGSFPDIALNAHGHRRFRCYVCTVQTWGTTDAKLKLAKTSELVFIFFAYVNPDLLTLLVPSYKRCHSLRVGQMRTLVFNWTSQ